MDRYGIPEIFEEDAQGELKEVYEDIKYVLKVPVVNFIFRALAYYPEFLIEAWNQIRPNMLTLNIEKKAEKLRNTQIKTTFPKINWYQYYNQQTLDDIDQILFVFRYVNPKLLLIATAWAESLSERPILSVKEPKGFIHPGISKGLPSKIDLMKICEAPPKELKLLQSIQKEHHAMDLASDFRALIYYYDFLKISWDHLKKYVGTNEYIISQDKLKQKAISYVHHELSYPVTVNRRMLEQIYSPSQIAGIIGLVNLFQNFLPGLIIDLEYFHKIR